MTIRDAKGKIEDRIPVRNVLLSVFDKSGLDELVPGLLELNSDVRFMSTGGTYKKVKDLLGDRSKEQLIEVADYTGFPEMEGGLVKTLHPKIHAGILGERNNPAHQEYLRELGKTTDFVRVFNLNDNLPSSLAEAEVGKEYVVKITEGVTGVYIDMVVVNLYPFEKVTADSEVTFEKARGNKDIGGPTMLRAAAKNFLSCAAVCDPNDYTSILEQVKENQGRTTFDQRLKLTPKVFEMTGNYDLAIAAYDAEQIKSNPEGIRACYDLKGGK